MWVILPDLGMAVNLEMMANPCRVCLDGVVKAGVVRDWLLAAVLAKRGADIGEACEDAAAVALFLELNRLARQIGELD